ncbi:MAG: peptide ABC transporter substrate-binding protein [Clostridiales bacterium]|nr:peptide ABC transporter substrate-binding protein [Clostridiales bacterium]
MSNTPGKSSKVLSIVLALALVAAVAFGVITNQQKADLEKKVADLGVQVSTLEGELATAKSAAEEAAAAAEEAKAAAEQAALLARGASPDWAQYDALIAEIKSTTDFVHREALMHQAEEILMGTAALVPIYYYNDIYMVKPEVQGLYVNNFGTKFFDKVTKGEETTLKLQLSSEPDKLDPALNSSVDGAILAAASFGGLYTYDENGELAPNFATGHELSEDGLTYVFTMREGLKWSNGDPLTAKDFEYSWKRAVAAETAADYSYMFDSIKGFPDALDVSASEDGTTFTVNLNAPVAYFLDLAAFPTFFAVHEPTVENAEGYKNEAGEVISPGAWALEAGFVSSGPFTLAEWVHNESMVYVKNPNYWDAENVPMERLELMLSADDVAIFSAYQAGDLDFIDAVPPDQIKSQIDSPEFHKVGQLGTYYGLFNVKSKLFDGMTVEQAAAFRKAITVLIDRDYIVETVAQTGQKTANSFIPADMLDGHGGVFKQDDADYTYPVEEGYFSLTPSVEDAVAYLKEAGLEVGDDNMLVNPITITYIYNTNAAHASIAELIQQDLAQVGIELKLESMEWNVFLNERKEGNFDFARNGWIADFNDPINMLEMWTTDSGNNDAQFGR